MLPPPLDPPPTSPVEAEAEVEPGRRRRRPAVAAAEPRGATTPGLAVEPEEVEDWD